MKEGINPKLRHWLETPRPRIKKLEKENDKGNFFGNLLGEIKRVLEEF